FSRSSKVRRDRLPSGLHSAVTSSMAKVRAPTTSAVVTLPLTAFFSSRTKTKAQACRSGKHVEQFLVIPGASWAGTCTRPSASGKVLLAGGGRAGPGWDEAAAL